MAGDTAIAVIGDLTDDPELRFTPSGAAVARFRIASTPRYYDRHRPGGRAVRDAPQAGRAVRAPAGQPIPNNAYTRV